MSNVLSLSKARKAKARVEDTKRAEQNRIVFGRTKLEKQLIKAEKDRLNSALNGVKLDSKRETEITQD